jgi:NAD(P)-dependent dehydrogenase (short-subunit alcohol dehydrogenase family)
VVTGSKAPQQGPVLVTGAARGLGTAIAIALAERGIEPILLGRSLPSLQNCTASVSAALGLQLRCVAADVSNWAELQPAITAALAEDEWLHGVVNNAGVIEPIALVEDSDPAAWARCIQVNLLGPYHVLRACLPRIARGGVIANLSSGAASSEHAGWSAYAASKAALERLSATLANERPDLTVVAVRPGVTDTGMQAEIRGSSVDNAIRKLRREDLQPPEVPARAIASLFGQGGHRPELRVFETSKLASWAESGSQP